MANKSGNGELQRNVRANECFVCKQLCDNTCSRCGEFYCSKQCQTADWREHKYHCLEIPELITPTSNNNPKFQSENRKIIQRLRLGEHRSVWVPRNESDNSPPAAGSRHCERADNDLKRDDDSVSSLKPAAFNFTGYPKYNDDVVIIHVRYANCFYIRACSSENDYMKNERDFDDYGRWAQKLPSMPQRNDVVLVDDDGKFRRALVLNGESKDRIEVGLVDIGRKTCKTFHEMRQISDKLKNRARCNFMVTLDHIPRYVSPVQFKKFSKFLNHRTVFKIKFNGYDWDSSEQFKLVEKHSGLPIQKIVLGDASNQFRGNEKKVQFVEMNETSLRSKPIRGTAAKKTAPSTTHGPINSSNAASVAKKSHRPISFSDLTSETLPEVAELVIIDNTSAPNGYVSAVAKKNIVKLEDLHRKVNEYGNAIHELYEPKYGDLCLVKFNGEWYRALKYMNKFLFIDWGDLEDIGKHDIRRYPAELKDPCYTFVCNIVSTTSELVSDPAKIEQLMKLLEVESGHPDCVCVKDEDLMEYKVKFPKLLNFFD